MTSPAERLAKARYERIFDTGAWEKASIERRQNWTKVAQEDLEVAGIVADYARAEACEEENQRLSNVIEVLAEQNFNAQSTLARVRDDAKRLDWLSDYVNYRKISMAFSSFDTLYVDGKVCTMREAIDAARALAPDAGDVAL